MIKAYIFVNIFIALLPWGFDSIVRENFIRVDTAYAVWYSLIVPILINIILVLFFRKEKYAVIMSFVFTVLGYVNSYFFLVKIFNDFVSNFNPTF